MRSLFYFTDRVYYDSMLLQTEARFYGPFYLPFKKKTNMLTLKQLDEHVESVDLPGLQARAKAVVSAEELPSKICEIYSKVRPVLDFLDSFWLVPKKWRMMINTLMITIDQICPQD